MNSVLGMYDDFFICYNWMPLVADHCVDHSSEFYKSAGVSRLHNHSDMNPNDVKKNDIVFVKTDELYNGFFQNNIFPHIDNEFTLVSGISSYNVGANGDMSYIKMLESPKLKKWFCTNPPRVDSEKIMPLPIGFEEPDRDGGNQDVITNAWNNQKSWEEKRDMIYLSYHTVGTNPLRDSYISYLKTLDFVCVEEDKLSFSEYLKKMGDYKFNICLEGAGYDTHRNYESLLVGSVPIMINSTVKRIYNLDDLPSVFVYNWKDVTKDFFIRILNDSYSFYSVDDFLKIGFHAERIMDYAKGSF